VVSVGVDLVGAAAAGGVSLSCVLAGVLSHV
jgi:hypothetical protein